MSEGRGDDRRAGPRVPPPPGEVLVMVESFGQFLEQYAMDISEGGMFLRNAAPPPVGARVRIAIRLRDGSPLIRGEGEVVWRRESGDPSGRPPGAGIRFLELDPRGRELIRRLVAERRRDRPVTVGWGEPFEEALAPARDGDGEAIAEVFAAAPDPEGPGKETVAPPLPELEEVLAALPEPEEVEVAGDPLRDLGRPLSVDETGGRALGAGWSPVLLVGLSLAIVLALAGFGAWWRATAGSGGNGGAGSFPTPPEPDPVAAVSPDGAVWRLAEPFVPGGQDRHPEAPGPEGAGGEDLVEPAPATPTPAPSPRPTAAPQPSRPARTVTGISWRTARGETVVTLAADGRLDASRLRIARLENPPRVLIRVRGIVRPYPRFEIPAGGPHLVRIRTGLHRELDPPELWVVLDLVGPGVRMRRRAGAVVLTGP